jgi:hypothetical protein
MNSEIKDHSEAPNRRKRTNIEPGGLSSLQAEGEGFEPPDRGQARSALFKSAAFDRSATPPGVAYGEA